MALRSFTTLRTLNLLANHCAIGLECRYEWAALKIRLSDRQDYLQYYRHTALTIHGGLSINEYLSPKL